MRFEEKEKIVRLFLLKEARQRRPASLHDFLDFLEEMGYLKPREAEKQMRDNTTIDELLFSDSSDTSQVKIQPIICPLTNKPCMTTQCRWWMKEREKCAIIVIAEKL